MAAKVLTIPSGKGGVGKTTVTAEIGVDPSAVEVRLYSDGRERHWKADVPLAPSSRRKRIL